MTTGKVTFTYNDLIEKAINYILSLCKNIDSQINLPITLQDNFQKTYISGSNPGGGATVKISGASKINIVTRANIIKDFESFMTSCGITNKKNTIPTTRGLINFWNNVASFCTYNLKVAISAFPEENPERAIIYEKTTLSTIPFIVLDSLDETEKITAEDINNSLDYIQHTSEAITKIKNITYDWVTFCSCSSSSSSSSCSSSIFIAYMHLGA